jgi:hypothetical protein
MGKLGIMGGDFDNEEEAEVVAPQSGVGFSVVRDLVPTVVEKRSAEELQAIVSTLKICVPGWVVTLDYSSVGISGETLREFEDWKKVLEFRDGGFTKCYEDIKNKLITLGYIDGCTRMKFRPDQMALISKYLESMSFYKTYKLGEVDLTLKDWQILLDFPDKTSDDFYKLLDLQLKDKVARFFYDEYSGTVSLKPYLNAEKVVIDDGRPYNQYQRFSDEQIELLDKYNPIVFKPIRDAFIKNPSVVYRRG